MALISQHSKGCDVRSSLTNTLFALHTSKAPSSKSGRNSLHVFYILVCVTVYHKVCKSMLGFATLIALPKETPTYNP